MKNKSTHLQVKLNRNNKKKIINDPVYGFIAIPDDLIFDIIEHPFMQRLRRISQLGLSHLVYPGAIHSRFQHVLGTRHQSGKSSYRPLPCVPWHTGRGILIFGSR